MDPKKFEIALNDVETRLDRLKALYEQWFQGFERMEPSILRKNMDRALEELRRELPRNATLRFRYQQIVQRYTTYIVYWRRVARQIEEGTYARDILRARRRRSEGNGQAEQSEAGEDAEVGPTETNAEGNEPMEKKMIPEGFSPEEAPVDDQLEAASPEPRKSFRPVSRFAHLPGSDDEVPDVYPEPPRTSPEYVEENQPAEMSEQRIRDLYDQYVEARRLNNEPTDNVKLENLAKRVRGMMPALKEKYAGKPVDFEIVVKNGRVALKPVAK